MVVFRRQTIRMSGTSFADVFLRRNSFIRALKSSVGQIDDRRRIYCEIAAGGDRRRCAGGGRSAMWHGGVDVLLTVQDGRLCRGLLIREMAVRQCDEINALLTILSYCTVFLLILAYHLSLFSDSLHTYRLAHLPSPSHRTSLSLILSYMWCPPRLRSRPSSVQSIHNPT